MKDKERFTVFENLSKVSFFKNCGQSEQRFVDSYRILWNYNPGYNKNFDV